MRIPKLCGPRKDGRYYVTDPDTHRPEYFGRDRGKAEAIYQDWLRRFLARGQAATSRPRVSSCPTVAELCERFMAHARAYYRKRGKTTPEVASLRQAIDCLAGLAHLGLAAFTTEHFTQAREVMIAKGWCRSNVNQQAGRLRRVFRKGVEWGMVPAAVLTAIEAVAPLRKGRRGGLREGPKTGPVARDVVEATMPFFRREVHRAMVRLHLLTGMRSEELCAIRPKDIDRAGPIWIYHVDPDWNKTDHHEGRERVVYLGKRCQEILAPWLSKSRGEDQPLFRARGNNRRIGGGQFTPEGYRVAVANAVKRANAAREKEKKPPLPHWFPRQVRKRYLTDVRARFGLEGAAAAGGHSELETTAQHYAERQQDLAKRIAEEMG